jgi:hypothetical protein
MGVIYEKSFCTLRDNGEVKVWSDVGLGMSPSFLVLSRTDG